MKCQKVDSYKPDYARAVKTTAITLVAAAMLAGTGCIGESCEEVRLSGDVIIDETPIPTEEVTETGYIDIENTPEPWEELTLSGEVAIDESGACDNGGDN